MGSSSLDQNEILEVESALEQAILVKVNHMTENWCLMHLSHLTRLTVYLTVNLRHKCDAYNPFESIDIQDISLGNTTTW